MDAKEFLKGYRIAQASIESLARQLDSLYDSYQSPRFDSMPKPKGAMRNPVDDLVEKREKLRERLVEELTKQTMRQLEINRVLLQLPDANERRIADLRYLEGKEWEAICKDMNYSMSGVFRVRESLLGHVQNILDEMGKSGNKWNP